MNVSTISHSPVESLYHQLHSVYGPLLSEGTRGGMIDSKLMSLVAELEAGLGNVLRLTGGSKDASVDPGDAPLVGIASPLDEFKLWSEIAFARKAGPKLKARANEMYRAFEPMKERFERLNALPDE